MKNLNLTIYTRSLSFLVLVFFLSATGMAQIDRTKRPEPAAPKTVNISESKSFTLENGLQVVVVENHKQPLVSMSLLVDNDPVLEKEQAGFVEIMGKLLRTATTTKTKDQIDKEIDLIGADLNISASGFYATSLKKQTEKLAAIISDILNNTVFKEEELTKLKEQAISGIAESKDDPNSVAGKIFKKAIYGEGHPYAEIETEKTIEKVTLDACKKYFDAYYRPNVSYLSIVGDITFDDAQKLAKTWFGSWKKSETPKHEYAVPEPPLVNKLVFVDLPSSVQSVIQVGYPVVYKPNSPDFLPARVMNTVLGGGVFRLFENLREKHAYTYGAYSTLQNDKLVGSFAASASVRNEVTDSALTEVFSEMNRIRTEPVGETELNKAVNYLTGAFAIQLESPQTVAQFATNIARYNLPKDFYQTYLTRLAAVSAAQVQEAAKKYILPEQSYVLVVGKQSDVLDKVKKFSVSGKIEFYDNDGNKIDPDAVKVPEGITPEKIIEKYIDAIGGREKVLQVKDRTMEASMTMQGMNITATTWQKMPDKFLTKMSFSGMEQTVMYDGQKGGMYSSMGNKELEGKDLEDAKYRYNFNNIMNLKELGVKATLTGIKKVNDKDAYVLEFKLPSGTAIINYFDVENGLRVREESELNSPQGTFTQVMDFLDYREVNGVKYSFDMKTSVAGQTFDLKVSKIEVNTGIEDSLFTK